uniref:Uncharacterized protein n=1 Tax=Arundo donax TaxID=35708 RepID=A0A0A8XPR5_ARUDO
MNEFVNIAGAIMVQDALKQINYVKQRKITGSNSETYILKRTSSKQGLDMNVDYSISRNYKYFVIC